MKNKLYLVFAMCLLAMSVNAQTIYHYQRVAEIDPNTKEKKTCTKGEMHLIFQYGQACICDEEGKISIEEQGTSVDRDGHGNLKTTTKEGYTGHLDYVRTEDNVEIYHSLYTYDEIIESDAKNYGYGYIPKQTISKNNTKVEKFLYVSLDRSKLNMYKREDSKLKFISEEKFSHEYYYVYELYDTDEVGNKKEAYKFDPNNHSTLY